MQSLCFLVLLGVSAPSGCEPVEPIVAERCTSAAPCPVILGASCAAGADTVIDVDDGVLVASVVTVHQVDGANIMAPWTRWSQVTGAVELTCPEATIEGSGHGNVVIYGLATQ